MRLLSFLLHHPLNVSSGRLAALLRLLGWQVRSRLTDDYLTFKFISDKKLFAKRGMTGATGNYYCGLHEFEDMGFLIHYLRPSDQFLDIGANVGSYTILAAGGVGAKVKSFEPLPSTFMHLKKNVQGNELQSLVQLHNCGLSRESGVLRFSSGLDTVNHVLSEAEEGDIPYVEVSVTTIDEIADFGVSTVIKIDVEGHEFAVLNGARRLFSSGHVKVVILELNGSGERYGVADDVLREWMRGYGFVACVYEPMSRNLAVGDSSGGNTIFVSDFELATARVQSAPKYLIGGRVRI